MMDLPGLSTSQIRSPLCLPIFFIIYSSLDVSQKRAKNNSLAFLSSLFDRTELLLFLLLTRQERCPTTVELMRLEIKRTFLVLSS